MTKKKRKIYVVCPVRGRAVAEHTFITDYVKKLEKAGCEVYLPGRDTGIEELPSNGWGIILKNEEMLRWANEVHVIYSRTSQGSAYDVGFARALKKRIVLVRRNAIEALAQQAGDGFAAALLEMEKESQR
jgi:hypothetical protein